MRDEQGMIADLAPEILETYCNIQRDNLVILEKLEKATDKREELTAIHEANMNRFNDILQGYLKIKNHRKIILTQKNDWCRQNQPWKCLIRIWMIPSNNLTKRI